MNRDDALEALAAHLQWMRALVALGADDVVFVEANAKGRELAYAFIEAERDRLGGEAS